MNTADKKPAVDRSSYHHGDLREALIGAVLQLIEEQGAENFSLADACRRAKVSTAAPYKHFKDRDEILEIIVMRAFNDMADHAVAEVEKHGPGTPESMVALGKNYIGYAVNRPALFRLMFGQNPKINQARNVQDEGRRCFGSVIEQVAIYCRANGLEANALSIATRLWTFVHGMASLIIDDKYQNVVPGLDLDAMLTEATIDLLPTRPGK
ncbi:MAG: TetR/AcrR family transcriptional regulator [Pseudomonadota bacterium]